MLDHIMRTTIQLEDRLLSEAKQYAARLGTTLTSLIADGLRLILSRPRERKKRTFLRLTTFKGKGVQPGVDLDNSASLLDLLSESK